MAVRELYGSLPYEVGSRRELHKRRQRWSFFQTFFALTYVGIVCDIVTTALGVQRVGAAYEQNPVGGVLIAHLGWIGIFALTSALCALCYVSFRMVYWRKSTAWSAIFNPVLFCLATFRWLVVILAVQFLVSTPH